MKETLQDITDIELSLQFDSLKYTELLAMGTYIMHKAEIEKINIIVEVYAFNKTIFLYAGAKTSKDNENWVKRKRNTVLHFGHSSKYMGIKLQNDQNLLATKYGLNIENYAIVSGSMPILLSDSGLIGTLTVSGLTPDQDQALVVEAMQHIHLEKSHQ